MARTNTLHSIKWWYVLCTRSTPLDIYL